MIASLHRCIVASLPQVVGHLKTCLTLALGCVFFDAPLSARAAAGLAAAALGMALYTREQLGGADRSAAHRFTALPSDEDDAWDAPAAALEWVELDDLVAAGRADGPAGAEADAQADAKGGPEGGAAGQAAGGAAGQAEDGAASAIR